MLVHTSPSIDQHRSMATRLRKLVGEIELEDRGMLDAELEQLWSNESARVPSPLFGIDEVPFRGSSTSNHVSVGFPSDHHRQQRLRRQNQITSVK